MDEAETPEAAAAPAPEPAMPAPDPVEAFVERWWADHFPGSAVAQSTLAWNVAHGAKEALKTLLRERSA